MDAVVIWKRWIYLHRVEVLQLEHLVGTSHDAGGASTTDLGGNDLLEQLLPVLSFAHAHGPIMNARLRFTTWMPE